MTTPSRYTVAASHFQTLPTPRKISSVLLSQTLYGSDSGNRFVHQEVAGTQVISMFSRKAVRQCRHQAELTTHADISGYPVLGFTVVSYLLLYGSTCLIMLGFLVTVNATFKRGVKENENVPDSIISCARNSVII